MLLPRPAEDLPGYRLGEVWVDGASLLPGLHPCFPLGIRVLEDVRFRFQMDLRWFFQYRSDSTPDERGVSGTWALCRRSPWSLSQRGTGSITRLVQHYEAWQPVWNANFPFMPFHPLQRLADVILFLPMTCDLFHPGNTPEVRQAHTLRLIGDYAEKILLAMEKQHRAEQVDRIQQTGLIRRMRDTLGTVTDPVERKRLSRRIALDMEDRELRIKRTAHGEN